VTARIARVAALLVLAAACGGPPVRSVVLATTSSVQNSGLLDHLQPAFSGETGIELRVHQVGSGRALQMLAAGLADVAITHAPTAESAVLQRLAGAHYRKIMFNDFVVLGPAADPAGIRGTRDVVAAFERIAAADVNWISRGDESGTHERERAIWAAAARTPAAGRTLVTGLGMSGTLRQADGRGYTLSDRATFLQLSLPGLAILCEGDDRLLNTYAVVTRAAEDGAEAAALAAWLATGRGRRLIEEFEVTPGVRAFTAWPAGCPAAEPAALPCGALPKSPQ
jgi:tungstate transport system substrate-binding protein